MMRHRCRAGRKRSSCKRDWVARLISTNYPVGPPKRGCWSVQPRSTPHRTVVLILLLLAGCTPPTSPRVDVDWNRKAAGQGSDAATNRAIAARDAAGVPLSAEAAVSDYQAHQECAYQARVAAAMRPGIVPALFAGIGVGDACMDYMRSMGRAR